MHSKFDSHWNFENHCTLPFAFIVDKTLEYDKKLIYSLKKIHERPNKIKHIRYS